MKSARNRRSNRGVALTESAVLLMCVAITWLLASTWLGWRLRARWVRAAVTMDEGQGQPADRLKDEARRFCEETGAPPNATYPLTPPSNWRGQQDVPATDVWWSPNMVEPALPSGRDLAEIIAEGGVPYEGMTGRIIIPQEVSDAMDAADARARREEKEIGFSLVHEADGWKVLAWNKTTRSWDKMTPDAFTVKMGSDPAGAPYVSDKGASCRSIADTGANYHSHAQATDDYIERSPSSKDLSNVFEGDAVHVVQHGGQRYVMVRTTGPNGTGAPGAAPGDLSDQVNASNVSHLRQGYPFEASWELAVRQAAATHRLAVYQGSSGGSLYLQGSHRQ